MKDVRSRDRRTEVDYSAEAYSARLARYRRAEIHGLDLRACPREMELMDYVRRFEVAQGLDPNWPPSLR